MAGVAKSKKLTFHPHLRHVLWGEGGVPVRMPRFLSSWLILVDIQLPNVPSHLTNWIVLNPLDEL